GPVGASHHPAGAAPPPARRACEGPRGAGRGGPRASYRVRSLPSRRAPCGDDARASSGPPRPYRERFPPEAGNAASSDPFSPALASASSAAEAAGGSEHGTDHEPYGSRETGTPARLAGGGAGRRRPRSAG